MFEAIRLRRAQGSQYIADLRGARPEGFRGRPVIDTKPCADGCRACQEVCPTSAIELTPVRLDLGRCVFCNECALACPEDKIAFGSDPRMSAREPAGLVAHEGTASSPPVAASAPLARLFGRSLRMRQVSAGGCNACELELNALSNVNFDLQRYGIEWVASPRHADALVLTGPLTRNMARAVRLAWDAMPDPRLLVTVGACAISGGLHATSAALERGLLADVGPTLYVPGCPPHPLTFANAILELLARP